MRLRGSAVRLAPNHLVEKRINAADTSKMMYLQHFSYISAGAQASPDSTV